MELIATGGSGHRLQSGSAQVLPEAERAYKRENHSEFALFLIFSPSDLCCWPFSSSHFILLFWNFCTNRSEAELLLTPTLLRSAQLCHCKLICFKREKEVLFILSFPLKFPDIILQIAKTIGPISSAEELLSTVFESVSSATASIDSPLARPGQYFTWYLCRVPDLRWWHFGLWWCSSNRLFVSPCHQMQSEKLDHKK